MQIDPKTLDRLSQLDLEQYAGNFRAIQRNDNVLYNQLFEIPVNVRLTASRGVCENCLYDICVEAQGNHESFRDLRRKIDSSLAKRLESPRWQLLTVSFNGVYIGNPEDLLNFRKSRSEGIIYPTKGLGEKLAEVTFISGYPEI